MGSTLNLVAPMSMADSLIGSCERKTLGWPCKTSSEASSVGVVTWPVSANAPPAHPQPGSECASARVRLCIQIHYGTIIFLSSSVVCRRLPCAVPVDLLIEIRMILTFAPDPLHRSSFADPERDRARGDAPPPPR